MTQIKTVSHFRLFVAALFLILPLLLFIPLEAYALSTCGEGKNAVKVAVDVGCVGKGNPIADMSFALIRFLSAGAGVVIIGSIIYAGIQYTMSYGDPQKVSESKNRIMNSLIALLLFIFAYAILGFVIPGQFLK